MKDPGKFVSVVLGGLDRTVSCTLRPVIVAQIGLAVVKRLSRQTKSLSNAVSSSDFWAAIFRALCNV